MEKGYVMALGAKFLGFDRLDKYQMAINKDEAKIIVLIYDLYLHGCSTVEITNILKIANIPTPSNLDSSHWAKNTVRSILKNEKYCGDAILQKTYVKSFFNPQSCKK